MYDRRLLQIILFDSLSEGDFFSVPFDGNVSINGLNGSGKTSLLALLPIFYGRAPGQVVTANSGRESFLNWYLPRSSSFIVYEYQVGPNEKRCVVLTRDPSNERVLYRFINSHYQPELFINEQGMAYHTPSALKKNLAQRVIEHTDAMGVHDYKQIILSNRRARADTLGLTQQRRTYSIAQPNHALRNLDEILHTLILSEKNANNLHELIRSLISDKINPEGQDLDVSAMKGGRQILDVINAKQAYDKFIEVQPLSRTIYEKASQTQALEEEIGIELVRASRLAEEQSQAHDRLDQERSQWLLKRKKTQQDHEEQAHAINKSRNDQLITLDRVKLRLGALVDKERHYANEQAEDKLTQQRDEKGLHRQKEGLEKQLALVQSQVQDIEKTLSANLQSIQEQERVIGEEYNAAHKTLIEKNHERNEAIRQEIDTRTQKAHLDTQALLTQAQASSLRDRDAWHEARVNEEALKKTPLLEEDRKKIEQAQEALEPLRQTQKELEHALKKAQDHVAQLKTERENAIKAMAALRQEQRDLQAQEAHLLKLLNPPEDSLLWLLHNEVPDWAQTIGKVIDASLLLRTDLQPTLNPEQPRTDVYGVSLSLDAIELSQASDKQRLSLDIQSIKSALDKNEQAQKQAQGQDKKLVSSLDMAIAGEQEAKTLCDAHLRTIARAQEGLAALKARANENHILALEQAQLATQKAHQAYEQSLARIKAIQAALTQQCNQLMVEQAKRLNQSKEELALALTQLSAKRNEGMAQCDQQKKALQNAAQKAKQEKGVDVEAEKTLKESLALIQERLQNISNNRAFLNEYVHWKENELTQRETLEGSLRDLQEKIKDLDEQIAQLDQRRKQNNEEIQAKLERLEQAMQDIETSQKLLDRLKEEYNDPSFELSDEKAQRVGVLGANAADISKTLGALKDARQKNLQDIRKDHDRIRSTLLGIESTKIAADLISSIEETIDQQLNDQSSSAEQKKKPSRVLLFSQLMYPTLEKQLVSQHDALQAMIGVVGNLIDVNLAKLKDIKDAIAWVNTQLNQRIRETIADRRFHAIRDMKFSINSLVEQDFLWEPLERHNRKLAAWKANPENETALNELLECMKRVEHLLKGNNGALLPDLGKCFRVIVTIDDQGSQKDLVAGSLSTGTKMVVNVVIYMSIFDMIRQGEELHLSMPVDEVLAIDMKNYPGMKEFLNARGISLIVAFPDGAPERVADFEYRYRMIREGQGGKKLRLIEYEASPVHAQTLQSLYALEKSLSEPSETHLQERA